jgi:hypothetical protein
MLKGIIFSDEVTFHLSGKVNRLNIWIWGSKKPGSVLEMECGTPKVNVVCAVTRRHVFDVFLFVEKSVMGQVYQKCYESG